MLALLVGGFLFSGATTALAQADGNARGRGGRGAAFQNMTEEQQEAMRQMNQETRELSTQWTEARTALNEAIYAETVDESKIREKSAAVAKIEGDLNVARAKAFAKVRSKFTPEQITAMKRMGAMGFAGRGGRGGRGRGAGGNN